MGGRRRRGECPVHSSRGAWGLAPEGQDGAPAEGRVTLTRWAKGTERNGTRERVGVEEGWPARGTAVRELREDPASERWGQGCPRKAAAVGTPVRGNVRCSADPRMAVIRRAGQAPCWPQAVHSETPKRAGGMRGLQAEVLGASGGRVGADGCLLLC